MKFRYKNIAAGVNRPIIPIGLQYGKSDTINYEVLIDSGADINIFNAEIGKLLGIDIYTGKRFEVSGITGKSEPYFVHDIKVSVGGKVINVEAGFMVNPGLDWYGVVGQKGFFDKFVIKFDYSKKEIEIK